jgi:hypothetical protein
LSSIRLIPLLHKLLREGAVKDEAHLLHPILDGLAHASAEGWIVSHALLQEREALNNDAEFVLALLGLQAQTRQHWLQLMAARCSEAGSMADGHVLMQYIKALAAAAAWVEAALPQACLTPGPDAATERELLGFSLEQAAALYCLARILASCFALNAVKNNPLSAITRIDPLGVQAENNWCQGRLLALPSMKVADEYLLSGDWRFPSSGYSMEWLWTQPWLLLMTMTVFAQDAWRADGNGGVLLELSRGQNPYAPSEVTIVVQSPEGDEVCCGTLADLLLSSLSYLGIRCFPRTPKPNELNALLSTMVGDLLKQQIWRYQDGASGENGQYLIHPQFADECYRLPGSKVFNRTGRLLWQAIRICAESLRKERRSAALSQILDRVKHE